ncbi:MAG: hypothetical protein H0W67_04375 [Gemmatimonadales bacterium]|nr:hypothetical protein [Gemmatimonadales bacterium]
MTKKGSATVKSDDYAILAGRSDAVLEARTGRTWTQWVDLLDSAGASAWPHPAIARHIIDTYGLSGWWAQGVTVGYERIKGLRAVGQRRDGRFEVTKSRMFAVPLERLYEAFHDAHVRRRWLTGVEPEIRASTPDRSMRMGWPDGTSVAIGFTRRGESKSQAAIQHERLPDGATAVRMKEFWSERLDALTKVLAPATGKTAPAGPS